MDLKEAQQSEGAEAISIKHWYYYSKYRHLQKSVAREFAGHQAVTIVDVGCGSGIFLEELAKDFSNSSWRFLGVDLHFENLPTSKDPRVSYHRELPPGTLVSLFVLMDVIEHVPEETVFLETLFERDVGKSALFFVSAPAFQILWSGHDVFLGHYRRYTIDSLTKALQSHICIKKVYFIYGMLFLPVLFIRLLKRVINQKPHSDMRPAAPWLNFTLRLILALEQKIAGQFNRFFGLTLILEGRWATELNAGSASQGPPL